jgi:CheY-like chemotaxis protein
MVVRSLVSVDDDESVRESLPDLLTEFSFAAEAFSSAEEFLASDYVGQTRCLILDIAMPGMTGLDPQRELTRRRQEGVVGSRAQSSAGDATAAPAPGLIRQRPAKSRRDDGRRDEPHGGVEQVCAPVADGSPGSVGQSRLRHRTEAVSGFAITEATPTSRGAPLRRPTRAPGRGGTCRGRRTAAPAPPP